VTDPAEHPDDPHPDDPGGHGPPTFDPDQIADALALAEADVASQAPVGPADVAPGVLDRFAAVRSFDEAVDAAFDRLRGHRVADRSFYAVTELADFGLLWLLVGAARGLRSEDEAAEFWRLAAVLGVESVVVNGAVKSMFRRERPVVQDERPHRLRIPLTTSFPSGHASTAMVAATLLGEGRRTAPLYYALGLWVASSRIYVRIHHASDVAGGLVLGLTLGHLARRAWPGRRTARR
jgi:undecaprenyl-diphosphatase